MKSRLIGHRSDIRTNTKLKIHLENDRLVMYGSTSESSGCILRGALSLWLKKRTSFKSLTLKFCGAVTVHWSQLLGNGYERKYSDHQILINHTWTFLPPNNNNKAHLLGAGNHSYEFDLVLPGKLPESTHVAKYYVVQYQLKAIAERSSFLSANYIARKEIHLSRQKWTLTSDYLEPMTLANHWDNKLDYDISLPTKVYSHGDTISITIQAVPLAPNLKIRYVTCTFKEYMVCKAVNGWFNGKNLSHGRIISYIRKDVEELQQQQEQSTGSTAGLAWSFIMALKVPESLMDIQCDAHNDSVRVKHKLKFIMSIENEDGHISELRAVLPVIIVINNSKCALPAYEDTWRTLPYDPRLMLALLGQSMHHDGVHSSNRSSYQCHSSPQEDFARLFTLQQQRQHTAILHDDDHYGFSTLPSYSSIMMLNQ